MVLFRRLPGDLTVYKILILDHADIHPFLFPHGTLCFSMFPAHFLMFFQPAPMFQRSDDREILLGKVLHDRGIHRAVRIEAADFLQVSVILFRLPDIGKLVFQRELVERLFETLFCVFYIFCFPPGSHCGLPGVRK